MNLELKHQPCRSRLNPSPRLTKSGRGGAHKSTSSTFHTGKWACHLNLKGNVRIFSYRGSRSMWNSTVRRCSTCANARRRSPITPAEDPERTSEAFAPRSANDSDVSQGRNFQLSLGSWSTGNTAIRKLSHRFRVRGRVCTSTI